MTNTINRFAVDINRFAVDPAAPGRALSAAA